jgi:peptide-methionine (S)-S-oxide reductase
MSSKETALLFGGCFWGIQDLVRRLPSVNSTRVGYSDVANAYATHRNHGTHGEALEVVFGPARTSWRALLEFFFLIHNPSTPNRQGNDGGCYYRSGIYYKTPEHRQILWRRLPTSTPRACGRARWSLEWSPPAPSGRPSRSTRTICNVI